MRGLGHVWSGAVCLFLLAGGCVLGAVYGGGSGTEGDPYRIAEPDQLNEIGLHPEDWSKHFILTADIDMSGYTGTQYHIIGNNITRFSGTFDGNGHAVRNLTYTADGVVNDVGLFGYTSNATIRNLGVEAAAISANGSCAGGLVSSMEKGTIINCYSTGIISSMNSSGTSKAGGLIGNQSGGLISGCYSSADVSSSSSWRSYAGGFVADQYGSIINCYSTGTVSSFSSDPNSYSTAGGFAGFQRGVIETCYSTGAVRAEGRGTPQAGGLVGSGGGVVNSFWDVQSSGLTSSAGGWGRLTDQMKQASSYLGWNTPTETHWVIQEGVCYPKLAWEGQPGAALGAQTLSDFIPGAGTARDPYRISTPEQMIVLRLFAEEWNKVFCLENDIDLSGTDRTDFNRIGVSSGRRFTGVFDGNGHTVSNVILHMPNSFSVGLFGFASNGAIRNLGVLNVDITGYGNVGGLVGYNKSEITNCYTSGSVEGVGKWTGGFVGENYGRIDHCHSSCTVNVEVTGAGGFIGCDRGFNDVTYCHATGSVSGTYSVGGFMGSGISNGFNHCYSTGSVTGRGRYAGGFAGHIDGHVLRNCFSTGSVNGNESVGGLIGNTTGHTIIFNCYSSGFVSGNESVGGLIGWSYSYCIIDNCYSSGFVSGNESVGGLIGWSYSYGTINNCYSSGSVKGNTNVGGIIGFNEVAEIRYSYATGAVSGENLTGGLVGHTFDPRFTACFWDTQTSGITVPIGDPDLQATGAAGKTTAELMMADTFRSAGWDFVDDGSDGNNDYWRMCSDGADYPRLSWEAGQYGDFACPEGVGVDDLAALAEQWLIKGSGYPFYNNACDGNLDGRVDLEDFGLMSEAWGEGR